MLAFSVHNYKHAGCIWDGYAGKPYCIHRKQGVLNSLAPGKYGCDSKNGISDHVCRLVSSDLLIMMPSDECHRTLLSRLVQVMASCRQTTSHYLSQCWLSSLSRYGVARSQWVKTQTYSDHSGQSSQQLSTTNTVLTVRGTSFTWHILLIFVSNSTHTYTYMLYIYSLYTLLSLHVLPIQLLRS